MRTSLPGAAVLLALLTQVAGAQVRGVGTTVSQAGGDIDSRRFHALLIAVQEYADSNVKRLSNPIADAEKLRNVLTTEYQFPAGNVTFLPNPGRRAILRALDSLAKALGPGDNLLIFYAGHGVWDEQLEEGFWLPADGERDSRDNWISNGDVRLRIRGIRARHTLVIADACFAGGILDLRDAFTDQKAYTELDRLQSRKAMTSGAMTTVPDRSVFARYLVEALDRNEGQMISASDLFASLEKPVISNSPVKQVPQFGDIREAGHKGGDFVFVRRPPPSVQPAGGVRGVAARYDVPILTARVKSVRFFESGKGMPAMNERVYATQFDSARARYVNIELELKFDSLPRRAVEVPMQCSYTRSDGSVAGIAWAPISVQAEWPGVYKAVGWGSETPGSWRKGSHRVRCYTDSATVAAATFEIVGEGALPVTHPIASLSGRVTGMRFWEQARGKALPAEARRYASTFAAVTTRAIGFQLDIVYPAPGKKVDVPVRCTRYWPDGRVMGYPETGTISPDPTWTSSSWTPSNGAMGWTEPGQFGHVGRYQVECSAEGKVIAVGNYEITSPVVIPALNARLTGMQFWEQPTSRNLLQIERKYARRFSAATARHIGLELRFEAPAITQKLEIAISCVWYRPDGSVLNTNESKARPELGWKGFTWSGRSTGWEEPGNYTPGTYRVECTSDGNEIAAGSFDIEAPPPPGPVSTLAELNARVGSMRFWEEPKGQLTAHDQRVFKVRFDSSGTRLIGVQIDFEHPAPGRVMTVPMKCVRYLPDGAVMVVQEGNVIVQPTWTTSAWTPGSWGWPKPGNYKLGVYRVECSADGKVIASGSFEIVAQ